MREDLFNIYNLKSLKVQHWKYVGILSSSQTPLRVIYGKLIACLKNESMDESEKGKGKRKRKWSLIAYTCMYSKEAFMK